MVAPTGFELNSTIEHLGAEEEILPEARWIRRFKSGARFELWTRLALDFEFLLTY